MAPSPDGPRLDVARLVAALDRFGVEYLLVGGVAAQAYGAERQTVDFDCLARRTGDNLDRLAAAMRSLDARLRIEGLSDEEAALMPTRLDRTTLARIEISTWQTAAGAMDVLADIPDREGRHLGYDELVSRANRLGVHGIVAGTARSRRPTAADARRLRPGVAGRGPSGSGPPRRAVADGRKCGGGRRRTRHGRP